MGWGDELIVTGQARVLQAQRAVPVIVLDRHGAPRSHALWEGNPRIVQRVRSDREAQTITNGPGVRPYIAEKRAERWTWRAWEGPPRGEIYFTETELAFGGAYAGRIVLEPHVKYKASPNKDWGWTRWNRLAWLLQRQGFRLTQLGPLGTPLLDGGVEHVITNDFRMAAAVLSTARAAVLPEGGLHHAAAAVGTPAVVIFGGFIAPAVTGYAEHVNLFAGADLGCGMRVRCDHCREAMARISPEQVCDQLTEVLGEASRRRMAS